MTTVTAAWRRRASQGAFVTRTYCTQTILRVYSGCTSRDAVSLPVSHGRSGIRLLI